MKKAVKDVQDWVKEMVHDDAEQNTLFQSIDDMFHGTWEMPEGLKSKKMRPVVSLVPHDALNAATKAYSGMMPRVMVKPMHGNQADKDRARQISDALKWQLRLIDQRKRILWDIVHSAMRYDIIAARVDCIPLLYPNNKRAKLFKGMFDIDVYHPGYVHYSEGRFGLDSVALVTNHDVGTVITEWDKRKDANQDDVDKLKAIKKDDLNFVLTDATYFDDNGDVWQTVFGMTTESEHSNDEANIEAEYLLYHKKLKVPFINWVIRSGGSSLETGDYTVHPLLAPLVWTGQWNSLNIKKTLMGDEVVKYAESPRRVNKTWNREGVTVDYKTGSDININPQESSEVQPPPPIDNALLTLIKGDENEMSNTTIAAVLYQLADMSNTPYATVSAVVQNTLSSLTPQRKLSESALEGISNLFLQWSNFSDKPISYFRENSFGGVPAGEESIISPDDYDLENMYINVELGSDNPMDEMQRINMGIMKNEKLQIPLADIHSELGYEDAENRMKAWKQEKLDDTEFGKIVMMSQAEAQLLIDQAKMQMQIGMQQAAQQAAQQPPQGSQQGAPSGGEIPPTEAIPPTGAEGGGFPSDQQGNVAAFENTTGQNYNPNAGGQTPVTPASPMTRERVSGKTKGKNQSMG